MKMTERDFQQMLGKINPAQQAALRQAAGMTRPDPAPKRRPRHKRGPVPPSLRPQRADAPFAVLAAMAGIVFAVLALAAIAARIGF